MSSLRQEYELLKSQRPSIGTPQFARLVALEGIRRGPGFPADSKAETEPKSKPEVKAETESEEEEEFFDEQCRCLKHSIWNSDSDSDDSGSDSDSCSDMPELVSDADHE